MKRMLILATLPLSLGCLHDPGLTFLPPPTPLVAEVLVARGETEVESTSTSTRGEWLPEHLAIQPGDFGAPPAETVAPGELTLREALSLALLRSPALGAGYWEMRAAEARRLQASLLPNPEIGVEVEQVDGTAPEVNGLDLAETTVTLSQLVELGGKRGRRERVGMLERDLTAWDYEAARMDLLTRTTEAFIECLAAQERLSLAEEMLELAEKGQAVVQKRIEAGKVSPLEASKARVFSASRRIEVGRAEGALASAEKRLAAAWGGEALGERRLSGRLETLTPVPPLAALEACLAQNPDLARWSVELAHRQAALRLETAGRIPDLELSAGVKHENETEERSYLFGASLPLPLFDRNQGAIAAARHGIKKAEAERRAAELELQLEISETHQALLTAYEVACSIRDDLLPQAREALEAARRGQAEGKLEYLEILDAQRTWVETREQRIAALADYHRAVAALERLIGTPLCTVGQTAEVKP